MSDINPDSLFQNLKLTNNVGLETWNPSYCGEIDITIHSDGHWSYLGSPFNRLKLVKLFASVLRKEGIDYYLVTPMEKVKINVESEVFITTSFEFQNSPSSRYAFKTNLDEVVIAGSDHPILVTENTEGEPYPTILVRNNLRALISRSDFYQLVDHALSQQTSNICSIMSLGETFVLGSY